jgi:hypothetical protein
MVSFQSKSPGKFDSLVRTLLPSLAQQLLEAPEPGRIAPHQARGSGPDLEMEVGGHRLLLETIGDPSAPRLLRRWERLQRTKSEGRALRVVVIPHITAGLESTCAQYRINWIDLAGNASIRGGGVMVHVRGRPSAIAKRGRPSSVFERRSSRVARALLINPETKWSVAECARVAGLNVGHVSRILARLTEDELLVRDDQKRFEVRDPRALLDAWWEAADFSKHVIVRGHIQGRSGEEVLQKAAAQLREKNVPYAATGLPAAWMYDRFAMFRLVTLYVQEWSPTVSSALGFREEPTGANTWVVLPADDGVFAGAREMDGIRCVHPVQVYVDLKDQPERAGEAAEHLIQNLNLGVPTNG